MEHLKKREIECYGNKLLTDKQTQLDSKAFLEWVIKSEDPNFIGRSFKVHNEWIKLLDCKVLRIDGEMELKSKTEKVISEIKTTGNKI